MRRAADNIDYILPSLRINLSALGQGGWGTVMYVARGPVEMTDMGYKCERFYDSGKEEHERCLIDLGLRLAFARALGDSAADLCLNDELTPAVRFR